MSEVQPLIDSEAHSAWDDDIEPGTPPLPPITSSCTSQELFKDHPHDLIRFLQSRGMQKLAEFTEEDAVVFSAFGNDPLLTFGSPRRELDAEKEWRQRLRHLARPKQDDGVGWSNKVTVEAYVVEIRRAAGVLDEGVLHRLVRAWQAKRCSYSVFALPAVHSVIAFKWKTYARRLLFMELAAYGVWLVAFYTFTGAMQDEDLSLPLHALLHTPRGKLTVGAEVVALLAMSPFLLLELGTVLTYGVNYLRDPSNLLDCATYALQIATAVMHLGRVWVASRTLTAVMAVQCILLMMRLQYFTQVFRPMRFSFPTIVREVLMDVGVIMLFILLVCVAYGAAFHITFRQTHESPEDYSSLIRSVLSCFEHIYGDIKLEDFINAPGAFPTLLALSYIFIMGFVLVNLVIGVIITSLDRVLQHEGEKQLCNQARIIDELESFLPAFIMRSRSHAHWTPEYVHVLRINPHTLDSVEKDRLWSMHGDNAPLVPNPGDGRGGGEGEGGDDVKQQLTRLKEQLFRQEELLERVLERVGERAAVA